MRWRTLCHAGLSGLVVVAACQRGSKDQGFVPPPEERRECPKTWQWDSVRMGMRGESIPVVPNGTLTGPGRIQNVPEFHDCQRFIVPDGDTALAYGGLFAIFANEGLERLDTLSALDTPRRPPGGLAPDDGVPSAEIVAFDGDYDPLGIKIGFNCLYLFRRGSGGGRAWEAIMVSFGYTEQNCRLPVDPNTLQPGAAHRLVVRVDRGPPKDIVPKAAKWDWDPARQEHYIGIYCGVRDWCEVGRPRKPTVASDLDFTSSIRFLDRPEGQTTEPGKRRVYGVRGWYDEQYLSERSATGAPLRPTRILGTLIPDSSLAEFTDQTFVNDWIQVAEVSLLVPAKAHNPYEEKLNLSAPGERGRLNTIELCHAQTCPGVTDSLRQVSTNAGWDHWYAKITRASDGRVQLRTVKRCDLGIDVPATARWRWRTDDEKTWVRCARGCCELF